MFPLPVFVFLLLQTAQSTGTTYKIFSIFSNESLSLAEWCNRSLTKRSDSIRTPNYQRLVQEATDCVWNIIVQKDRRIKLSFHPYHSVKVNYVMTGWIILLSYRHFLE